jgi:hypothetical protein
MTTEYLQPDYRTLLTEEDKATLRNYFQAAFIVTVKYTPGRVNNIEAHDMNVAKTRLSELVFLKNEIFDLYKEACEVDSATASRTGDNNATTQLQLSKEMQEAIKLLERKINMLDDDIAVWSQPEHPFAEDNPEDVPDLNGVPATHYWRTSPNRELSKNANANIS